MAAYLGIRKLVFIHDGLRAPLVTDSPFFYIALAVMIIGSACSSLPASWPSWSTGAPPTATVTS